MGTLTPPHPPSRLYKGHWEASIAATKVTRTTTTVSLLGRLGCPRLFGPPAGVSAVRQNPAKRHRTEVKPDTFALYNIQAKTPSTLCIMRGLTHSGVVQK